MNTNTAGIIALALLGSTLGACATTPPEPPVGNMAFSGLGGTSWRLVEFQSMDDAQGTTKIAEPERYTLTFNRDGSLAARLDCNRGVGAWSNPIANATGGTLELGPMAVTKALCPEPSFSTKLEMHLRYVRSFVMRDGRMYMSLMADGGILVWEPIRG